MILITLFSSEKRVISRVFPLLPMQEMAGSTEIRKRLWRKNLLQSPKGNVTIAVVYFRKNSMVFACVLYG